MINTFRRTIVLKLSARLLLARFATSSTFSDCKRESVTNVIISASITTGDLEGRRSGCCRHLKAAQGDDNPTTVVLVALLTYLVWQNCHSHHFHCHHIHRYHHQCHIYAVVVVLTSQETLRSIIRTCTREFSHRKKEIQKREKWEIWVPTWFCSSMSGVSAPCILASMLSLSALCQYTLTDPAYTSTDPLYPNFLPLSPAPDPRFS